MRNLVIATNNIHKVKEIREILSQFDLGFKFLSINELGASIKLEETGDSFKENATQKALQLAAITSYPVLADDSGLEVDALNGRPGIFSARFAGQASTDMQNNKKLIAELEEIPWENRKARYRCVMALVWLDKKVYLKEGKCEGYICRTPKGENGFGYDPYFFVPLYKKTMAQLDPKIKNLISHRALALKEMAGRIKELNLTKFN